MKILPRNKEIQQYVN